MNIEHVKTELAAEAAREALITKILAEGRNRKHHRFSASKLQAIEACVGFDGADSENEASAAGTLQHYSMDTGDLSPLDEYQQFIVRGLSVYRDQQIAAFRAKHGAESKVLTEGYVIVDEERPAIDTLGTSGGYFDLAVLSPSGEDAHLWDWKFGKWEVEPTVTNLQGFVYALGLRREHPQLKRITVEFVMPYLKTTDPHTFTEADFPRMYARVKLAVARRIAAEHSEQAKRTLVARDLCCCFCANLPTCPAILKLVLEIGRKYAPLQVPASVLPSVISDPLQAGQGMKLARLMTAWGKGYSARCAEKAAEDPAFLPDGWQLVTRADRVIQDVEKIEAKLRGMGITDDLIQAAKKLTLTAAGKLVRAAAPRGSKDDMETTFFEAAEAEKLIGRETPITFLQAKREKLED